MHVRVWKEMASLRDTWQKLQSDGRCHVFQTFEWVNDWLETVGKSLHVEPFIISASIDEQDEPFLIIPFAIRRMAGVRILGMAGGYHADYTGGVIAGDADACMAESLWGEVMRLAKVEDVDLVWLSNIPEQIDGRPNPVFSDSCIQTSEAHAVSIEGSWRAFYESRVKSRIRADSRRQIKRLSEIGELSFRIAHDESEINMLTEIMINQKRARYKAMGVKDQFLKPENRKFFMRRNEGNMGVRPHVAALLLDDRILAVHWGEIYHGTFYYLMPSHDPLWEKYSPGRLLLEHLLEWCFSNGLRCFDFTGGGEAYKLEWANSVTVLYKYERALTIKGKAFLMASSAYRNHVRGIIHAIRKGSWKR